MPDIEDRLIEQLKGHRALVGKDVVRTAGATPQIAAASIQEGPSAGYAMAKDIFQPPPSSVRDPEKVFDAKMKVLQTLQSYEQDRRNTATQLAVPAMAKRQQNAAKAMEMAIDTLGAGLAANAQVAGAYIQGVLNVYGDTKTAQEGRIALNADAGNIAGTTATALEKNWGPEYSRDGAPTPDITAEGFWIQAAMDLGPNPTNGAKQAMYNTIQSALQKRGVQMDPREVAALASRNSGGDDGNPIINSVISEFGTIQPGAGSAFEDYEVSDAAIRASLPRGAGSIDPDKVMEVYKGYFALLEQGEDSDPEAVMKGALELINKYAVGDDPPMGLEDLKKLYDELDKPLQHLPTTANQLKQQVMGSADFQTWKSEQGLLDDQSAWRAMRHVLGQKLMERRRADAGRIQEMQVEQSKGVGNLKKMPEDLTQKETTAAAPVQGPDEAPPVDQQITSILYNKRRAV